MITVVPVRDPARAREELAEYRGDRSRLVEMRRELEAQYPGQWVAIYRGQLFHGPDLDALFADLLRAGGDPASAPRLRLSTDDPVMIL